MTIVATAACFAAGAAGAQDADSPLTYVLPEAIEVELALSGGPEHLRDGATVYAFTETGYVLVRQGTNGFTCFNNRDSFYYGGVAIKPTCWDPAGADSYVPVMFAVGAGLAAGAPHEDIKAAVEAGFASGEYRSPDRLGVAYMLAGDIVVDRAGAVVEQVYPGHIMIYAVGVTNEDIGFDRDAGRADPSLPYIFSAGAGGDRLGYLISAPGRAAH